MSSIKFHRSLDFRTTVVQIFSDIGYITIRLESKLNARQRRTVAKSIFVQLKPLIGYLRNIYLHHLNDVVFDFHRAELRGLNAFQQSNYRSNRAQYGLTLRLIRLQKGLTLRELAKKVGIMSGHLSEIERGLHFPHIKTQLRIAAILKNFESRTKAEICLNTDFHTNLPSYHSPDE